VRILLVQPPLEDFYTTPIRLYPLGLLYAARVLEDWGATVAVLDCLSPLRKRKIPVPPAFSHLLPLGQTPHFFKGYYRFGKSERGILSSIRAFGPDLVGISSQFTAYYKSVGELARLIKREMDVPIFIGGNHATAFAPEIRRRTPEIDFVLTGPAEECLPGFLNSLRPGSIVAAPDWRELEPSHHLLRGEDYKIGRENAVSLTASRGCPYDCDFCSVHRMFGKDIGYRSIDSVLAEMRLNLERKNVRIFNFEDDNLSHKKNWFLGFLKAVIAEPRFRGIELTAMNGLCYPTLDEEVLEAMARAGFRELNLALVSRDPELRKTHGRPCPTDSFDKLSGLIRAARRLSFFIIVYVIIGLPGQTYSEVRESVDWLAGQGVLVGPSVFYLAPGSRLYEKMAVSPKVKEDWNLYRSSAFAVETDTLSRAELLSLFSYVRARNLEKRSGK
jgi:radical SAM superfamily enzyme YgiQ (UPF0313 family)